MSNNRGPWATSSAQNVSASDHAAMAVQVGTLPTPPAEVSPASTLAQALAWLISVAGNVENADKLDGEHGSYYRDASNLNAGTVPLTRLSAALAQIGALTPTTGGAPYFTAPGGPANIYTTSSWFRGSWAPLTDAAAAKTLLALAAVATSGSASDITSGTLASTRLAAALAAIGALTPAADRISYYTSASAAALATLGAWARTNLLPATTQTAAQTALGMSAVAKSGAYSDLTGAPTSLPASDVYAWAKAATKPTYSYSEISGTPSSLPASDVYAWAKAATKPSYSFSELSGTASASQIPAVNTAAQHDNDTSPASTAFVLLQSGSFRQVISDPGIDSTVAINYATHGGLLIKSISKGVLWKMPAGGTNVASGQYPSGDSVIIQSERDDHLTVVDFGLNGGNVSTSGGSYQRNIIIPGGSGAFYCFASYGSSYPWQMMHGAKQAAHVIDFAGGGAGETQSPYYAFKLPDLHSSTQGVRIELAGAGCRSTTSGYFGRAGAYVDATITASYRPGYCLEFVVGSNSTGATGSATLALLPLSSYTITAPGGGAGNSQAVTYSSGLAAFLAAISTRPTSTASNSALDAGSQGGPLGGPGQKPDLRSGYGGGGAVFDGAGSGQYGAGAGVARLHYSSAYKRPKVLFALGCNAANGSTTFKDFGPSAATITATGSIAHSTAQKYNGVNSIWLNGGYLSIGLPTIADFTAYSHVHIAMQWRHVGLVGLVTLFDSRTHTGSSYGFTLAYDPAASRLYLYEREAYICQYIIASSELVNKFNLIEVEIVPGVGRAFFRLWLNKSIVAYGFSASINACNSTDRLTIGVSDFWSGEMTSSDYIVGPCIMARL